MTKVEHKEGTDFNLDILCYEKLLNGIVVFEFKKKDDSIRKAIGTLNPEFIPVDKKLHDNLFEKSRDLAVALQTDTAIQSEVDELALAVDKLTPKEKKERKQNDSVQTYYDFESKGWRTFTKTSIIAIYE